MFQFSLALPLSPAPPKKTTVQDDVGDPVSEVSHPKSSETKPATVSNVSAGLVDGKPESPVADPIPVPQSDRSTHAEMIAKRGPPPIPVFSTKVPALSYQSAKRKLSDIRR
jgi:hypothetical protein